jgi:hypothetical protein
MPPANGPLKRNNLNGKNIMFRFTIRDVLWLTVVVAMGVGWWMEHRTTAATVTRLRYIATHLAGLLNGRDDLEVKVVNDHLYLRTSASQNPPPADWPK